MSTISRLNRPTSPVAFQPPACKCECGCINCNPALPKTIGTHACTRKLHLTLLPSTLLSFWLRSISDRLTFNHAAHRLNYAARLIGSADWACVKCHGLSDKSH